MKNILSTIGRVILANLFLLGVADKLINPLGGLSALPLSQGTLFGFSIALCLLEVYLAVQLLQRPSRSNVGLAFAVVMGFNVFLLYLWKNGASSCGCFDQVGIVRTPLLGVITNSLLCLSLVTLVQGCYKAKPMSTLWLLPAICTALVGRHHQITRSEPAPVAQSAKFEGRDILLKVAPDCTHCIDYTTEVLKLYPTNRVVAVTLISDRDSIAHFEQRFSIPLHLVDVKEFYALGKAIKVPDGYRIVPESLEPLRVETNSLTAKETARK